MINTMKNDTAIIAFLIALVIGLLIVIITQPIPAMASETPLVRNHPIVHMDGEATPTQPVVFMTADQYRAMYAPITVPTTTEATTTATSTAPTKKLTMAQLIEEIAILIKLLKATQGK